MNVREQRIGRLRAVQREFETAAIAIASLRGHLHADPSLLADRGLGIRDFRSLQSNLEATFLVRLYAEFEAGLRSAWRGAYRRTSYPRISDIIDAIAARRSVPQKWLAAVHLVRAYRNSLVHEDAAGAAGVSLQDACDHLCRFLSQLSARW